VTERRLDLAHGHAVLERVGGEGVAQDVGPVLGPDRYGLRHRAADCDILVDHTYEGHPLMRKAAWIFPPALVLGLAACGDDGSKSTESTGSTTNATTTTMTAGTTDETTSTTESPTTTTTASTSTTEDVTTTTTTTSPATTDVTTTTTDATSSTTDAMSSSTGGQGTGMEIVHADFEDTALGEYAESMVAADFGGDPPWNNGLDAGRASIVEEDDNRFLRVTFVGNQYGAGNGGVQFKVPFGDSYDELYLYYRVRFAPDFQWVKGGKLPGLAGGTAPTGCVDDTGGFSARMMWQPAGGIIQYMYFPEKVQLCGDGFKYMSGDNPAQFEPGTWHTVEHRLVMNTPGAPDGVLQAWFDGEPALDDQAFLYRLADATYGIDALYFSTFFGGNDASYAPTSDQILDFDDFIVSTGPIAH
jgi:hypothetical protein